MIYAGAERWRYLIWVSLTALALFIALPLAARVAWMFEGYLAFRVFIFRTVIYFLSISLPLIILASIIAYARRSRVA